MTSNQINYANYIENSRHNKESERQGRSTIRENVRHNKATEDVGWGNVGASYARAAAAQSSANAAFANVAESARHNQEMESLTGYDYETRRLNQEEVASHNDVNELIDQAKLGPVKLGYYAVLKGGRALTNAVSTPEGASQWVQDKFGTYKGGTSNGSKK